LDALKELSLLTSCLPNKLNFWRKQKGNLNMFVKTTNGQPDQYPYTVGNLRRDNPNTSFPKRPSDAMLAEWQMQPVTEVDRPTVDHTKNVTEGAPVLNGDTWVQVWEVGDATAEEIAERNEQAAASARSERDYMLRQTDWLVIKAQETGVAIPTEWATYRQALRDITSQNGFPHTIEWPTEPQ
jgi:hypothetical protein